MVLSLVDGLGYLGLAAVMLLESLFPPIPSEPFLLAAGLSASRGGLSAPGAVLAATAGTTLGATVWYAVARRVGEQRVRRLVRRRGRWLGVSERDLARVLAAFDRHRLLAVVVCRFLPVGRMAVSLPAGTCAMPLPEFVAGTALGSAVWAGAVVGLGRLLGEEAGTTLLARYDAVVLVLLALTVGGAAVVLLRRR